MTSSKYRIICVCLAVAVLFSLFPVGAYATSSSEIQKQINALKEQKNQIESQIEEVKAEYQKNEDEIADIIAQKNVIDQEINLLAAQIRNINEQISAYNVLIADKQEELDAAQSRYEELHEQSRVRIREMEEAGDVSYWSVLFHANSFSDLLDRLAIIEEIALSDKRRLAELREAAQIVKEAQEALVIEKNALEDVKQELDDTQSALDTKREEADVLLQELLEKTNNLELMQEELEAQEQEFLAQIAVKQQEFDAAKQAEYEAYMATYVPPTTKPQNNKQEDQAEDNTSAKEPSSTSWVVPTNYVRLSSPFGPREAPVAGASTYHQGVDLAAPRGTPVYATRSGIVAIATHNQSAGNYVQIDHQDGFRSVYMHLDTYCVSSGQIVSAGQQIGTVGTTGISNGYHLHFGISLNGSYVNPCKYVNLS